MTTLMIAIWGAKASAPSVDNDGDALVTGALYFNTTGGAMYAWNGSAWQGVSPDLVGDLTPQLGGDLDSNGNDILFGDNDKAIFGAGSDLQIYHDGTNSIINEGSAGDFLLQGATIKLQTANGLKDYLVATPSAEVSLYYDNAAKLATTSTGIDVTGTVTADGLTVDGAGVFSAASPNIRLDETDTTDLNTRFRGQAGSFRIETTTDAAGLVGTRLLIDHSTGDISFYEDTGTTPKFFWDASAEALGIGTSSPAEPLHVQEGSSGITQRAGTVALIEGSANTKITVASGATSTGEVIFGRSGDNDAGSVRYDHSTNSMQFDTNSTERLRIDSSGSLLVGTTSSTPYSFTSGGGVCFDPNGPSSIARSGTLPALTLNQSDSDGTVLSFRRSGTTVGGVTLTTSATSYNTSSDYRLKEDVQPMTGASQRVLALNPVNFQWKADGTRVDGFLAHEAQAVVPEAVTGEKDAVDAEGNPDYQAIDQSKLVPLLTAALQEALGEIESLKARVTALEAQP